MLNSVRKRYLGCLAGIFSLGLASSQLPSGPDPQPNVLVLKGRVIDGTGTAPLEQGMVILAAGNIQYVGKQGSRAYPATAQVLDVGDGTILPGLIDLHVHLRPHYWEAFLPAGVTTVRDANNALATLRALQQDTAPRPRLLYTGPMLDGPTTIMKKFFPDSLVARYVRPATAGPIGELIAQQVETPDQARAAVDSLAAHGASFVKLYEQLPLAAYQAAAAQARKRGLRVMTDLGMLQTRGLKGAQVDALQALQAGVQSIEHASGYALAYQRLGGDPMAPLDARLIDQLARATVRGRTTLVPTLSVFYGTVQPDSARRDLATLPGGKAIPAPMMAWFEQQAHQHTPASRGRASADLRLAQALVRRVHQLGGMIGAGTDVPAGDYNLPGGNLHRELALLVEAGLPPVAAIQAATGTAARLLGLPALGTLRRGNLADVVVVAGNPAQDIRATRRVRYIIQAGRLLPMQ